MNVQEFGKVAVLFGGTSAEREVSLRSGEAVLTSLCRSGVDAHAFDPKIQPLTDLAHYDRAFIVLHGRGGEDGSMQGALQQLAIPYTGSGVLACAIAMDKVRTKLLWKGLGLPTAPFAVVSQGQPLLSECQRIIAELGLPVMVKPANEGSSVGMAKANNEAQLMAAIETALTHDASVLVEAWIQGPEYTVAIVGDQVMPSIHMETEHEFYDYQAKYHSSTTQYHCPADLSAVDEQALRQLAKHAFDSLGCQGWGRVDVMRNPKGEWQLLEVNTVPGMTETSLVPKAAREAGFSFDALVLNVLALSR